MTFLAGSLIKVQGWVLGVAYWTRKEGRDWERLLVQQLITNSVLS